MDNEKDMKPTISIPAPRMGSDQIKEGLQRGIAISIPAPRMGSDK